MLPRLTGMTRELPAQRVEVGFVGTPPVRAVERASGVSEVEVDGTTLRCLVLGSFQPFLEALRGHEVISLTSTPTSLRTTRQRRSSPDAMATDPTTERG
jgi:hypothetical protein